MLTCPNCGAQHPEGTSYCPHCGAALTAEPAWQQSAPSPAVYTPPNAQQAQTVKAELPSDANTLGILALIFGILSLVMRVFFGGGTLFGIAAVVLGIIGNNKAKAVGMKNTLANAGLIMGIICCALFVLSLILSLILLVIYGISIFAIAGSYLSTILEMVNFSAAMY